MVTSKLVYFASDGKWFDTEKEAERHDLIDEISSHIVTAKLEKNMAVEIVKSILTRYYVRLIETPKVVEEPEIIKVV